MSPVAILKAGMVTPVGFGAPQSCAAMRATIDAFRETRFKFDGEWLTGAQVPLADGRRGRERIVFMAAPAIQECIADLPAESLRNVPLLLCLPEAERPGRPPGLDESLLPEIESRLRVRFAKSSSVLRLGRIGGVKAVETARRHLQDGASVCVVAGVDSLIVGATLETYYQARRLKTEVNSNGFIPGEAAAAVLLGPTSESRAQFGCTGLGWGSEPAPITADEPLRADGLRDAIASALRDASGTWANIDYRITDANGEQYWFKEAALALTRSLRFRKETMDLWHPADCIGEIGAAIVPCVLGVALFAYKKRYAPGPGVLCHFSADGKERGALLLQGTPAEPA